jgi:hypothetical protein
MKGYPGDSVISFLQWLFWDGWRTPEHAAHPGRSIGLVAASCLLLAVLSWCSLHFYSPSRLFTDAGVFAAVSQHTVSGKALYREVWDHKPPMVYVLNAIPLSLRPGSVDGIRHVERIAAIVGVWAFYFTLLLVFKNPWLAFLFSVAFLFHFFNPVVFQGGNLTEEYAVLFLLVGIFCAVAGVARPGANLLLGLWAGLFFSLAVFTKEPFLFSALPWIFYYGWSHRPDDDAAVRTSLRLQRTAVCIGGALLPVCAFGCFFYWQGNFWHWVDVLSFNYKYAAYSKTGVGFFSGWLLHGQRIFSYVLCQTWTVFFLFIVGVGGVLFSVKKVFSKEENWKNSANQLSLFPFIALGAFVMDGCATRISGFEIGHYYLQVLPGFLILCACGFACTLDLCQKFKDSGYLPFLVLLVSLLLFDRQPCSLYQQRQFAEAKPSRIGSLSLAIRNRARVGDTLWAGDGANARIYVETGLLSPTRYLYVYIHSFFDTMLDSAQEKRDRAQRELLQSPPRFFVASKKDIQVFRQVGLNAWMDYVENQYQPLDIAGERGNRLYVRKDS